MADSELTKTEKEATADVQGEGSGESEESKESGSALFAFKGRNLTHAEAQTEMKRLEEKESGSDKKLFKANALVKSAETEVQEAKKATRAVQLIGEMNAGGDGALKAVEELVKNHPEIGVTQAQLDEFRGQIGAQKGSTQGKEEPDDAGPIRRDELDKDLQEELHQGRKDRLQRKGQKIMDQARSMLDSDEVVGHIISDDTLPEGVAKYAEKAMFGELKRRAETATNRANWEPSTDDYQASLQAARDYLVETGYLEAESSESGKPGRSKRRPPSQGRAPGAPGSSLHRSKEPPKRPSSKDPALHDEWFTEAFNARLGARERAAERAGG